MTSGPKFRLSIAGGDNGWAAAHAAQGGGGFKAQFPSLGHQQVGNLMGFEVAPHILDGVEFRSVSREAFQNEALAGGGDVMFDQQTAMDGCAIPKDQDFARDMPLQVPEKLNDLWAFDAALVDLKVKPPQRQSANDGKAFPVEGFMEHWSLPARCPSADPRRAGAQPAFIDENDGSSLLAGFFFKAGQPTRCQRRMAFSSRSTALRSGLWQLNPLAPIKRQT